MCIIYIIEAERSRFLYYFPKKALQFDYEVKTIFLTSAKKIAGVPIYNTIAISGQNWYNVMQQVGHMNYEG